MNVLKCNFYVFPNITGIVNFQWKNTDVTKSQGMCHVIYTLIESSLCKA